MFLDFASSLVLMDTELQPGTGGAGAGPGCPPGGAGSALIDAGAEVTLLEGVETKRFVMPSPLASGETVNATYRGTPGEVVFALFSSVSNATFLPQVRGVLVPDPSGFASRMIGIVPAGGTLLSPVRVDLPPAVAFAQVYVQSLHWSSQGGAVLGSPRAVAVLGN